MPGAFCTTLKYSAPSEQMREYFNNNQWYIPPLPALFPFPDFKELLLISSSENVCPFNFIYPNLLVEGTIFSDRVLCSLCKIL